MLKPRPAVLIAMVLAAALTRLAPHPWNLTSIAALALFGGACFEDRRLAFAVPLGALLISDLALGFYADMPMVYLSFALVVGIGLFIVQRRRPAWIIGASLAGSILFFVTTNFGVWALDALYPKTWSGLVACYVAALPFFRNAVAGDLIYTVALFGGLALLEQRFSALRAPGAPIALALA